ncbi:MAG TPA: YfiR family protein [Polyangiaceae bacterium]|nr:YfiR family protein [Polyangiaceae bacterium]
MDERVGNRPIGITVIHKAQDANSERCAREWRDGFAALSNVKIRDRSVTLRVIPFTSEGVGKNAAGDVAVFVVCSGLSQESAEIARVSRAHRILTVGTVLSYVEQNMTFGVFPEAGKYQMVVNLRVAAAERITFSSSLLKLARVLR